MPRSSLCCAIQWTGLSSHRQPVDEYSRILGVEQRIEVDTSTNIMCPGLPGQGGLTCYRSDIQSLQSTIGRDLSHWLTG